MPTGFLEPMDIEERRRFAERNGLSWVSADDAADQLKDTSPNAETNNPFPDDEE
jgi:hypothetical protein